MSSMRSLFPALAKAVRRDLEKSFPPSFRRYVEAGEPDKYPLRLDFDKLVEEGKVLCGSPATVRRVLGRHVEQSKANYVLGSFAFGSLGFEETRRSLELFAREVMPAFSAGARL